MGIFFLIIIITIVVAYIISFFYKSKPVQKYEPDLNLCPSNYNQKKLDAINKKFQKINNQTYPWDIDAEINPRYGGLDDIDWDSVVFNATPTIILY